MFGGLSRRCGAPPLSYTALYLLLLLPAGDHLHKLLMTAPMCIQAGHCFQNIASA